MLSDPTTGATDQLITVHFSLSVRKTHAANTSKHIHGIQLCPDEQGWLSEGLWRHTFCNGSQNQDAGLLDDPVVVEEQLFQQGEEVRQQVVTEHVGQNVQSSR